MALFPEYNVCNNQYSLRGRIVLAIERYEKRVFARQRELSKESCERASRAWQRKIAGLPSEIDIADATVCQTIKMPMLLWWIHFFRDMFNKAEQRRVAGLLGSQRGGTLTRKKYCFYVKHISTFMKDMFLYQFKKRKLRKLEIERARIAEQNRAKEDEDKARQLQILKRLNDAKEADARFKPEYDK